MWSSIESCGVDNKEMPETEIGEPRDTDEVLGELKRGERGTNKKEKK